MKYFSLLFALVWAYTIPTYSQVSNDNEDEVYKVDSRMRWDNFVPGQVLVKFKDESGISVQRVKGKFKAASVSSVNAVLRDFDIDDMEKLLPNEIAKPKSQLRRAKAYNGQTIEERNLDKIYLVKLNTLSPDSTLQLVERLKALPEVEYAEPNYRVYITGECSTPSYTSLSMATVSSAYSTETTDDVICDNPGQNPLYSQQWGIKALNIDKIWTKPIINRKRPVIAILDTGVDITHPDLVDNIWTNLAEQEGEAGYDDDNNGIVDDNHGYDFVNNYDGMYDKNGHGTHVAGIAAASNNETGVIGANPQALIMPVKVLDDRGEGDLATIARGILYAVNNGADVINMSFGGGPSLPNTLKDALDRAFQTAVLVASAGNNGKDIYDNKNRSEPGTIYPGAYFAVLGVQATSSNGNLAGFSNYDSDGPTYSEEGLEGRNYELKAPGVEILSIVPNGDYRSLSGTSMSSPMVAGAISALKMVKEYGNNEALWGDLIHTNCDFLQAYDATPMPYIDVVSIDVDDQADGGNGDGMVDAGETIRISPVLRNTWGTARNINLHIEVDEDKASLVEIQNNDVDFGWTLSAFGYNTSENAFRVRIKDHVADGTGIKFTITVTCDNMLEDVSKDVILHVSNIAKLGGIITEDMTLTADKNYVVTSNFGIPDNVTLTIEPGTKIRFYGGKTISCAGTLIAEGTPDSPIVFEGYNGEGWNMFNSSNTFKYCIFKNCSFVIVSNCQSPYLLVDCVLQECSGNVDFSNIRTKRCNVISSTWGGSEYGIYTMWTPESLTNYVNNKFEGIFSWSGLKQCNFFNISSFYGSYSVYQYHIGYDSGTPSVDISTNPSYLGSGKESIVRNFIYDNYNECGFGIVDLSNMRTEPVAEAHGIVWKVVVDGYDAQDEYEEMPPLGIGNHVFQVYFNRPMNKNVAPQISFGVREPYTQVPVSLNGRWSSDGKIYTAFVKITGKTSSDGNNTIYVYGAEDDEFFEIPYEKTRFHINVQSAGSMATGFAAEAELGRVKLTWNNDENDFDDAMGFNVYRYTVNDAGIADTIRINEEIVDIETTTYTDYDVVPGTTYYYLYRVLSTDLQEYDVSNVVAVTPLTSSKGDANGSGDVDVADVITTVNYASGQQPKPFIFEAADMNDDLSIDILDVIGIIKQIMNPNAEAKPSIAAVATYTIEDGVVYVDSPVEIAGVQIQLATSSRKDIRVAEDMKGFEHTSAWLSDNDYLFLGYNMNGKTLTAGKHAILIIDDAQIADIRLSDAYGHNIQAVSNTVDKIDRMARDVMTVNGIYDLQGRKITGNTNQLSKLPKGVYIVNGQKVVR